MEKISFNECGQWLLKSTDSAPPKDAMAVPGTPLHVVHDKSKQDGNRYHIYHGSKRVGTARWRDGGYSSAIDKEHSGHDNTIQDFTGKMSRHP